MPDVDVWVHVLSKESRGVHVWDKSRRSMDCKRAARLYGTDREREHLEIDGASTVMKRSQWFIYARRRNASPSQFVTYVKCRSVFKIDANGHGKVLMSRGSHFRSKEWLRYSFTVGKAKIFPYDAQLRITRRFTSESCTMPFLPTKSMSLPYAIKSLNLRGLSASTNHFGVVFNTRPTRGVEACPDSESSRIFIVLIPTIEIDVQRWTVFIWLTSYASLPAPVALECCRRSKNPRVLIG